MTLLRTFEDEECRPSHGTLVLCDFWDSDADGEPFPAAERLSAHTVGASFACAGNGWLQGRASGDYQLVRFEVHGCVPPDDFGGWDDVMETPYHSFTGSVGLTFLTRGAAAAHLRLGRPWVYRVRVARRRATDDVWDLQFWAEPGTPELPRWLLRSGPAVRSGCSGWDDVLDLEAGSMLAMVQAAAAEEADGATAEQLMEQCPWLVTPLWPDSPASLPTGHADLDAAAAPTSPAWHRSKTRSPRSLRSSGLRRVRPSSKARTSRCGAMARLWPSLGHPTRRRMGTFETAYGIVVSGAGDPTVLVRSDGRVDPLGVDLTPSGDAQRDGRYLAAAASRRRMPTASAADPRTPTCASSPVIKGFDNHAINEGRTCSSSAFISADPTMLRHSGSSDTRRRKILAIARHCLTI